MYKCMLIGWLGGRRLIVGWPGGRLMMVGRGGSRWMMVGGLRIPANLLGHLAAVLRCSTKLLCIRLISLLTTLLVCCSKIVRIFE